MALVNSVSYDSWPVLAVARFRDPAARGRHTAGAAGLAPDRSAAEAATVEYLEPWTDPRTARSWL